MKKKFIIGISGASGAIYGIRLLQALNAVPEIETHLVVSETAKITIEYETKFTYKEILESADYVHDNNDLSASIASGSFKTDCMVIAPCSVKTMSQLACGNIDSLITRSADVILKERRKLVVMLRESPLHLGHLKNMIDLTSMGAIIAPPMPAFYILPKTIDDLIDHIIGKVLDLLNIDNTFVKRWESLNYSHKSRSVNKEYNYIREKL